MKKEIINSYENLLKDSYLCLRKEDFHLQEWQVPAIDFCLEDIDAKDCVNIARFKYGLDSGIEQSYKSCSDTFGIAVGTVKSRLSKVSSCLRNAKYWKILFEEGYLDIYTSIEKEKSEKDERDLKIGAYVSKKYGYDIFEDVRGYANWNNADLIISKYKPTLSSKAVNALARSEVLTFWDLLDFDVNDLTKLRGIGVSMAEEIKEFQIKLKEFDNKFSLMEFGL